MEESVPTRERSHSIYYHPTSLGSILEEKNAPTTNQTPLENGHLLTPEVARRILVGTVRRHSVGVEPSHLLLNGTKVLHVEDGQVNRLVTKRGVELNGWIYTEAATGEIAIELFKTGTYNVVLMDIHLGDGMNGYETTEAILKLCPGQLIFSSSGSTNSSKIGSV